MSATAARPIDPTSDPLSAAAVCDAVAGMATDDPGAQRGRIRRLPDFPVHLARAQAYQHDANLSKLAVVRDLVLGCADLSDAAVRLGVALVLLVPADHWRAGQLYAFIGNDLLGRLLGCSDSALRRAGRELEAAGLVLRHMDEANHPAQGRRFDVRPLAARHGDLSAAITATFQAQARARAARRLCATAPHTAAPDPAGAPAPAGPSDPAGADQPNPAGGAGKSARPYDTGTAQDHLGDPVQARHGAAVDQAPADPAPGTAAATTTAPPAPPRGGRTAARPPAKPPRSGYRRPVDPTPGPRSVAAATALLAAVSPDFRVALTQVAPCGEPAGLPELLAAADRLRRCLGVPQAVWLGSHGRLDRVERVAILVAAMAKPQGEFRTTRVAWACWLLKRRRGEIDIWATLHKLRAQRTAAPLLH
jgi:hypothetical protein